MQKPASLRGKTLEGEEKYGDLFHQSNDGIVIHDLEGFISDANQKVLDQFGYLMAEFISLNIADLHQRLQFGCEAGEHFSQFLYPVGL